MSMVSEMKGFIFLYLKSSRPSSSIKPVTAYLYNPMKRCSNEANEGRNLNSGGSGDHQHHERHDKAPSTAEEFKRVAEEKLRAAAADHQAEEASSMSDPEAHSVRNRSDEHERGADYPKK